MAKDSLPSHLGETRWTFVLAAYNSMAPAEQQTVPFCSLLPDIAKTRVIGQLRCCRARMRSRSQIFSESSRCAMRAL
jgi:hypothetical protein